MKLLDNNVRVKLDNLEFGNDVLDFSPKEWSMKTKNKLDYITNKIFCICKSHYQERKGKSQTGRKYLQKTYMIKNSSPKYTKNS